MQRLDQRPSSRDPPCARTARTDRPASRRARVGALDRRRPRRRMGFNIGDKAVVPALGVGIIKEIEHLTMDGSVYDVYVIKILDNGLTYKVPVNNTGANGIREVIPMSAVEKVY